MECIPDEGRIGALHGAKLRKMKRNIELAIERLRKLSEGLDPVQQPPVLFDPSDPKVIGELIAFTLLAQPRHPLGQVDRFYGSGVYAIYKRTDFPAYGPIANTDHPIYIGKADPAAHTAQTPEEQEVRLARRLSDHAKSIELAENLSLDDFDCRYLVVKSAWQKTAEDYLIDIFHPVWNNESKVCFGFGKHGDSSATRGNTRSPWDELHPGRKWASSEGNKPNPKSVEAISRRILKHFEEHPPISEPRFDRLNFGQ